MRIKVKSIPHIESDYDFLNQTLSCLVTINNESGVIARKIEVCGDEEAPFNNLAMIDMLEALTEYFRGLNNV
jgi:hypothetical protein